ncbi:MAG: hypothetical protein ACRBFS_12630 [Aureispira sp.]
MREELLDDELSIDASNPYYIEGLRKYLPALKLLSIVLLIKGGLGVVETFAYEFIGQEGVSNDYFSTFSWLMADVLYLLIGYKLGQQQKTLNALEKNSFEKNEATWVTSMIQVWRLFGVLGMLSLLTWIFG